MKILRELAVPADLNRNSRLVFEAGYENTGEILINLAMESSGLNSLENLDVLDVGCGTRFTRTMINRKIPIRTYTGIEVNQRIIDFLKSNVENHDDRFRFFHWNVQNARYNPEGVPLTDDMSMPIEDSFDFIWLFSVFTHLNPDDSSALLKILRRHIRPSGRLFFTAFIGEEISGFEDRIEDKPLLQAYYGKNFILSLIRDSGWEVLSINAPDPEKFIQNYLVCSPSI